MEYMIKPRNIFLKRFKNCFLRTTLDCCFLLSSVPIASPIKSS